MKLAKPLFHQILEHSVKIFETEILPLPNKVEVRFQSKEDYMNGVKENPLIKQQVELGFYKDIDKEYVGFAVVYGKDKFPMKALLGLPYIITICDEIAKEVLKPFTSIEIKAYLNHVYIHELTHIFDDHIKLNRPDIWHNCLDESNQNETLANEFLAEQIPVLAMGEKDTRIYKNVDQRLWSKVFKNMQMVRKQRGL